MKCLRCVQYSFQLKDRSCSLQLTNADQEINYTTGVSTNNPSSDCRLYYMVNFLDQIDGGNKDFKYCLVKKAADDYLVATPIVTAIVERDDLDCKVIDAAGKCTTCKDGFYLNTILGSCHSTSGTCKLVGCVKAEGFSFCTECMRGYDKVDGLCILQTYADADTVQRCKTVTNGECSECDPQYYLDLKDS